MPYCRLVARHEAPPSCTSMSMTVATKRLRKQRERGTHEPETRESSDLRNIIVR